MRMEARRTVAAIDGAERATARDRLCEVLWEDGGLLHSKCSHGAILMGFMPLPDEIDPTPAMQRWLDAGGRLAVPVSDWRACTMQAGEVTSLDETAFETRRHGIREPCVSVLLSADELAVVLVPGLAFDAAGGRLGRGGGFYDRFLEKLRCPTIGVCYSAQVVPRVSQDPHDRTVQAVIAG